MSLKSNSPKKAWASLGMIAVLVYVAHVIVGGLLWDEYSHLQQPISDLTASGAPNSALMLVFTILYGILAFLFALAFTIFESPKHHKITFWGGVLFVFLHLLSLSYNFFPEDLSENPSSIEGTLHLWVTALIVPFTILTPILIGSGFKREVKWRSFAYFSLIAGGLIIVFGSLSGYFFVQKLPYFGLVERLNIGVLQAWTFYFSYQLSTSNMSHPGF